MTSPQAALGVAQATCAVAGAAPGPAQQTLSPASPAQVVRHCRPAPQSAEALHVFGAIIGVTGAPVDELSQQTMDPLAPGQSLRQVVGTVVGEFWKTEVVVTATWKSMGSSPAFRRATLVASRLAMNAAKFSASFSCSPPIDPESSTTKSTSAVDMSESFTRSLPGWSRH